MGFILLSSTWIKIFGNNLLNLAFLSLFSYCLGLCICFYFTRKYFDEKIALLFSVLFAFSPLNMAMARRALMDSTLNLFLILSIWLFFSLLKERSSVKYVLFILVYSFTLLIKESALLLSLFFILYLICLKFIFKKAVYLKDLLSATLLPFVITGVVYISLSGSIFNIVGMFKIILGPPGNNQYAMLFGSGPWFRYIIDYILLSPWVVILSIGFVFYRAALKDIDEDILYFLLAFISLFFSVNIFTKNIRYAMVLDMPMRLFSVLLLKNIAEAIFPKYKYAFILTVILVSAIAVFDYISFQSLFLKDGIYDPASFMLLKSRHIIP
jgi:4-amino-4-deoxy-L-arabinose transferase-like glycosyltransferase